MAWKFSNYNIYLQMKFLKQAGDHPLSMYAKFSEKLLFLTPWYAHEIFRKTNISNPLIHTRTCTYQGVENVSFSENFACVLNGWPLDVILKLSKNVKTNINPEIPFDKELVKNKELEATF